MGGYIEVNPSTLKMDPVPQGFVPVDPSSLTLDKPKGGDTSPGDNGFISRVGSDLAKRGEDIKYAVTADQNPASAALQIVGKGGFGTMADVASEVTNPISEPITSAIGEGLVKFAPDATMAAAGGINAAQAAYAGFREKHPEAARDLESIVDIAPFLLPGGGKASENLPGASSGATKGVGKVLNNAATDAPTAIKNMKAATETVPGVQNTAAVASGDTGLLGLEKGLRKDNANGFSEVDKSNDLARNAALDEHAGSLQELNGMKQSREMVTSPLYEKAKSDLVDSSVIKPVLKQIDDAITNAGAGNDLGNELLKVKAKILDALPKMTQEVSPIVDASGRPISNPKFSNATQGPLIQAYRELRDKAAKIAGRDQDAFDASVKAVIKPIIHDLGSAIEDQSPNLKAAQTKYRDLSKPINQMETLQDIRQGTQDAKLIPGTEERPLVQTKWNNLVTKNLPDLEKTLSPEQLKTVQAIGADLDKGATLKSPQVKGISPAAPPKAGMAHLVSLATAIGGYLEGHSLVGMGLSAANESLSFLKRMSADKQQALLLEAMKDPKLASLAMQKASKGAMNEFASRLAFKAAKLGAISTVGSAQ